MVADLKKGDTRSLRVLVIDDHADSLSAMARLLRGMGHAARSAETCEAALAMVDSGELRRGDVDLIFGDVRLPDCDGVDLMAQLKARLACPAVAVSGLAFPADIARSLAAGLDDHLVKPVALESIRHALRLAVDSAA